MIEGEVYGVLREEIFPPQSMPKQGNTSFVMEWTDKSDAEK